MNFSKMQGCGNDFIVTHHLDNAQLERVRKQLPVLCDRRFGIGADGLIAVVAGTDHPFRMRIFNPDGTEPEMCGNGIRCMARYLEATGLSDHSTHTIETGAGVRIVERCSSGYRVAMGRPILAADAIPVARTGGERIIGEQLRLGEQTVTLTALSMGNPHAVIFEHTLSDEHVLGWGEALKAHPFFPKSVNVEFVQIQSPEEITIRVNERGVGETLACGTGACAAVVASILNNHCGAAVTVHLRGGDLFIEWSGDAQDPVYMSGPAEIVFEGSVALAQESA